MNMTFKTVKMAMRRVIMVNMIVTDNTRVRRIRKVKIFFTIVKKVFRIGKMFIKDN